MRANSYILHWILMCLNNPSRFCFPLWYSCPLCFWWERERRWLCKLLPHEFLGCKYSGNFSLFSLLQKEYWVYFYLYFLGTFLRSDLFILYLTLYWRPYVVSICKILSSPQLLLCSTWILLRFWQTASSSRGLQCCVF